MTRIAYIGTYVPQRCGIATYTYHLRKSVEAAKGRKGLDPVMAVRPSGTVFGHSDDVVFEWDKEDRAAYTRLAERLNKSDVSVVSLQHEFGIFGGKAGEYVLDLVKKLNKPLAVTFHTVFEHPEEPYRSIQKEIAVHSDLILVMNRKAIGYLQRAFDIPADKIRFVPHGTPEPVPEKREEVRQEAGWSERKVILSFGLLSRNKGYETVIRALPDVVRKVPEALYVIAGQTHPEVRKHEGEAYRNSLNKLIEDLGLKDHVMMIDRYMEEDELVALLSACDLYVTPYPGMQQITSGTLAYAVGLGRPVVSTPYAYAVDLLGDQPELLLAPGDVKQWADAMIRILSDSEERMRIERQMQKIGAEMHWSKVGAKHLSLFRELAESVPYPRAN